MWERHENERMNHKKEQSQPPQFCISLCAFNHDILIWNHCFKGSLSKIFVHVMCLCFKNDLLIYCFLKSEIWISVLASKIQFQSLSTGHTHTHINIHIPHVNIYIIAVRPHNYIAKPVSAGTEMLLIYSGRLFSDFPQILRFFISLRSVVSNLSVHVLTWSLFRSWVSQTRWDVYLQLTPDCFSPVKPHWPIQHTLNPARSVLKTCQP